MLGLLTVGDLVLVHTLFMQLSGPLNYLGGIYRGLSQAITDMENMFEILDQTPGVKDTENAVALRECTGRIEFDHVAFSYGGRQSLFEGLSFQVEPGSTVAFVGPSGCGKSSIVRLLYRFYAPEKGQVLIDGQDLSKLQIDSVRQRIAVVPQDPVLFNETVAYNIRYGRLDATPEEVEEAARRASLHETVLEFPSGYDTIVGERGLKLSGGEKQRLALARAFLKNPKILICDEATSALDSVTEADVLHTMEAAKARGITTVVVAHRLSTVKSADRLFVVDGGKISEQGTHSELLEAQGLYHKFWHRQQEDSAAGL
jgi:ABC-type multidrug transport system fused ATPase/permease subunit